MASVLQSQGKYDKALEWHSQAIDSKEKTPGKGHPSTLDTVDNMATVFGSQGQYEKAVQPGP
jgi:hypothetical protein